MYFHNVCFLDIQKKIAVRANTFICTISTTTQLSLLNKPVSMSDLTFKTTDNQTSVKDKFNPNVWQNVISELTSHSDVKFKLLENL
mgnify:CR=1 FL=1